jgi:hypothetical protein
VAVVVAIGPLEHQAEQVAVEQVGNILLLVLTRELQILAAVAAAVAVITINQERLVVAVL